jgi:hypothetical protein
MTEPKTLTNEERIDFLVKTGKLALETMTLAGEDFNPVIVHESMDGDFQMVLLAGGLGEDFDLLTEGLVRAAESPRAMISLTADCTVSDGGNVLEAMQVLAAFAGDDDVIEVMIPYTKNGVIQWGEPQRSVVESRIAGGLRTAVTASHTLGG